MNCLFVLCRRYWYTLLLIGLWLYFRGSILLWYNCFLFRFLCNPDFLPLCSCRSIVLYFRCPGVSSTAVHEFADTLLPIFLCRFLRFAVFRQQSSYSSFSKLVTCALMCTCSNSVKDKYIALTVVYLTVRS